MKRVLTFANIAFASMASLFGWWLFEGTPYNQFKITIDQAVRSGPIVVHVDLVREKLCSYLIERTVFDAGNNKVFDRRETFSRPTKLGRDQFIAPIIPEQDMEPGEAVYTIRVGSMCNPLQRIFPAWTGPVSIRFDVIE